MRNEVRVIEHAKPLITDRINDQKVVIAFVTRQVRLCLYSEKKGGGDDYYAKEKAKEERVFWCIKVFHVVFTVQRSS